MVAVSRVQVERVVQCPFSVAHEYIEDFLGDAERAIDVRIRFRDFVYGLRGDVRRPVQLVLARHVDDTEAGRGHDAIRIAWRAGTRLFPDFHGTLRLRIDSVETTRLTFEGTYRPPLGLAGRAFDVALGRRIARSTMSELLDRIAAELEEREAQFRAATTPDGPSGITA